MLWELELRVLGFAMCVIGYAMFDCVIGYALELCVIGFAMLGGGAWNKNQPVWASIRSRSIWDSQKHEILLVWVL